MLVAHRSGAAGKPAISVYPWPFHSTGHGFTFQISFAYSAIVRSLADLSALQDWIDAGAMGTFVADCRITSSVRTPWLSEWMEASRAAKAAVAG